MELLEAANVVVDPDAGKSEQYDGPGCVLRSYTSPVCAPTPEPLSNVEADADDSGACGVDTFPFAVITSVRSRARFGEYDFNGAVEASMTAEVEKALGRFLFEGSAAIPVEDRVAWIGTAEHEVTAGADERASILAAVTEFRTRTVGVQDEDILVHLGLEALWAVNALIIDDGDRLEGTNIKVVSSPGYPIDAIGVTGPIRVRHTSTQVLSEVQTSVNDRNTEATQIVSLEFDPCQAVRVGTV